MDLRRAHRELAAALDPLYGTREATLIADWVIENLTGLSKLERLMKADMPLSGEKLKRYHFYRKELLGHRPVQYVLHESWFGGLRFYVDENVLIPRPETEELVDWAASSIAAGPQGPILDVGTGSGCIAISLALKLPSCPVYACDISAGALGVAARNAGDLQADIHLHELDFLDSGRWPDLPAIQWLISNPPYIPLREKATMTRHVVEAEPSRALFVPDADPLVFYRALAEFAGQLLLPGGAVFVETHEDRAGSTAEVFKAAGFAQVIVRKDSQGKDRMIKASLEPAA
ncbi:MAG TPA: peptide chain release factor N(5)-glutamine methyltransferase [Puia sp.]|nr:peptide chain release factor N(5)-glutamine methyltransferase [Puia sp.]